MWRKAQRLLASRQAFSVPFTLSLAPHLCLSSKNKLRKNRRQIGFIFLLLISATSPSLARAQRMQLYVYKSVVIMIAEVGIEASSETLSMLLKYDGLLVASQYPFLIFIQLEADSYFSLLSLLPPLYLSPFLILSTTLPLRCRRARSFGRLIRTWPSHLTGLLLISTGIRSYILHSVTIYNWDWDDGLRAFHYIFGSYDNVRTIGFIGINK